MVLLWDTGLALLDIRQEEATRYLTVQPKAQLDFTSREQPADRPAGVVQEPDQTQPVAGSLSLPPQLAEDRLPRKRRRQASTRVLNDRELQSLARQQAPQAAVAEALERLRAWLKASGHETVAQAAQAEVYPTNGGQSLHLYPAWLRSANISSHVGPTHSSDQHASATSAPFQHLQQQLQQQQQLACSVCYEAWQTLQELDADQQSQAFGRSLGDATHPTVSPVSPPGPLAKHPETHPNVSRLSSSAPLTVQHTEYTTDGQAGCQQSLASPATTGNFADWPALHKVKHVIKPKLIICHCQCLLRLLSIWQSAAVCKGCTGRSLPSGLHHISHSAVSTKELCTGTKARRLNPPQQQLCVGDCHDAAGAFAMPSRKGGNQPQSGRMPVRKTAKKPGFGRFPEAASRNFQQQSQAGTVPPDTIFTCGKLFDQLWHPAALADASTSTLLPQQGSAAPWRTQQNHADDPAPVHAGSDKSNTAQPAGFRLDRRPQNGQESLVIAHGALVVLPAASRFLLSDVGRLQPLLPRMGPCLHEHPSHQLLPPPPPPPGDGLLEPTTSCHSADCLILSIFCRHCHLEILSLIAFHDHVGCLPHPAMKFCHMTCSRWTDVLLII